MGKVARAKKYRENYVEREAKSKAKQRKREREVSLIIPEIPGMNESINFPRRGENYWMECSEYMS